MKKIILGVIFALFVLITETEVYAQTFSSKKKSCQPSAQEILSLIKTVYNLPPKAESVLIAGEVHSIMELRHYQERRLTISLALAVTGRSIRTVNQPVYVIRWSNVDQTKTLLEINIADTLKGLVKDFELEMGDVVFVSKGCSDGKLLPPTEPKLLPGEPRQKDSLFFAPNKRITQ